jgi:hypothetical protein
MFFTQWRSWINRKFGTSSRGQCRSQQSQTTTSKPQVTVLEDRCLLAVNVLQPHTFTGLPRVDNAQPPDTIAAAGPSHIVEMVNTSIAFFDKAKGDKIFQQDFSTFFARVKAGPLANFFDPVVTYDESAGRFVVAALEKDDKAQKGFIDFAVSNDSNPQNGFTEMHRFEDTEKEAGTPLWGDYPKLGRNADAVVFTLNMYAFSKESDFHHVQVITIGKSSLLDADPSTLTVFRTDRPQRNFTLAAATMHDSAPGDPMWFVEESEGPFDVGSDPKITQNTIRVVQMTNVLSAAPTFTDFTIPVPDYHRPEPPVQSGGPSPDPTIDTRMLNAALRGNRLVASHHVGTGEGGHTVARWYEFNLSGSPTLTQAGDVSVGGGKDTYYPAIDIAANGDLGLSFIQSSSNEFMFMYVTGRTLADPAGVLQTPVLVKAGEATYQGDRAGDYSGISVDPVNPNTFWAANEYATNSSDPANWGTWIANFSLNGPEPDSHISRSRTLVAQVYQDLLHRPVDSMGLASWSDLLDHGLSRDQLVIGVTSSLEYRERMVRGLYLSILGREPDGAGLTSFINFLGAGGSVEEIKKTIILSPEYYTNRAGGTDEGFLEALFRDLAGGILDPDVQAHFSYLLTLGIPRDEVATQVLASPDIAANVVQSYYQRFLHRAADAAGLSYFTGLLSVAGHGSQFIFVDDPHNSAGEDQILAQIIGSEEYFAKL